MDGMGGKVVGGTMETVVGGERGVEGPGSEVVKGELGLWEQVVPAVRREGDMGGREDGDKVVFGGTNCSFRRVGAMVKGRDVLKGDGDRAKERCEVRRSLVVEEKMGQRVRKRAKKGDNRLEGRHVGWGSAGHHGVQVDVPMMQDDEQVLVSCRRFDRETTGQIGGRPLGPVEGEGVAVEGGVKGIGRDRGKLGDEGAVGWGSLCAFVFPALPERGKERESSEAGWGGNPSCGRDALPQLVEVTKGCGEREGRELAN
jgi:hypothetical protein